MDLVYILCVYRDVSVELPFVLMHPKPTELPISRPQSGTYRLLPPLQKPTIKALS